VSLTIASWNINSVRLRMPLVEQFLATRETDILCLQETKCVNDLFPAARLRKLGYTHLALNGQKGYHGVAIIAKIPLRAVEQRTFCGIGDSRHISAIVEAGGRTIRIHNFYVPSGGDQPDREKNPKFAHKLDFVAEMTQTIHAEAEAGDRVSAILVGDLNIAPLENDVWSHKQMLSVVSHTPAETAGLNEAMRAGAWSDLMREKIPPSEKLYTWWSYRARDWQASNRGRRLDHVWSSSDLKSDLASIEVLRQARGWERPSDHVPVIARFD